MSTHIAPVKMYLTIYVTLLALLAATVGVSYVNLGYGNLPLALGIAVAKATLIILFFMHVKDSPKLTWIFSSAAFLWLLILLVLSMADFLSRTWLDIPGK